jgi:hypothetical protein
MLSSNTLKAFVKMHEYKLNAKINGLKADRLENQLAHDIHNGAEQSPLGAAEHWNLNETDTMARRRPKSRYFNFILTTTHQ